MKLLFNKNDLINSLNISLKAIPIRSVDEIYNCIHIRANENIFFTSSDEELWIKTIVKGSVIKEGEVALNARLLSDIIKKSPSEEIIIEIIENTAIISAGKSKFKIPSISLEGVSDIPYIDSNYSIDISSMSLKELIKKTIFCTASNENTNILMNGEFIEIEDNIFKITALDGSRIAINKQKLKSSYPYNSCIVPAKTLNEISKIISGENDEIININIAEKNIIFKMNNTIILSRLINGNFFNIKKMLSADYEIKITTNKQELANCVDRSMLFSRESDNNPLIIRIKDQMNLNIRSRIGEMRESIEINKENEKNITIGINPKFLIEALKAIDDEDVSLYFINKVAPIFIKDNEEKYTYILLPVNFIDEEENEY